ncbi:MAG: GNAT family N-acetyltransferase, partial [Leifsonia sp.]
MTGIDAASAPADPTSLANLAKQGLRYIIVDTGDVAAFSAWLHADDRGFLQPAHTQEQLKPLLEGIADRRTTGVYDDANPGPEADAGNWPIATVNSWVGQLTIPGSSAEHPRTLPSWAISSVTVAATHRRRGIARNLLEGELRTAAALGVPMAMLTVSESTIYGRFGFAPATYATEWTIDTRRVRWSGAASTGRIEYISVAQYRAALPELHERVRLLN